MDREPAVRSTLFLASLGGAFTLAFEIADRASEAAVMIGGILSVQSLLVGGLAVSIGLMGIISFSAVRKAIVWREKQRSRKRVAAVKKRVEAVRLVKNARAIFEIGPEADTEYEETLSRHTIALENLIRENLDPPKGFKFKHFGRYMAALVPYVEEHGPEEASKMRFEIAKRVRENAEKAGNAG